MKRRRLLLALGVALAVLVVAGAVWRMMPPRPGITVANCARIKPGLRLVEVEAILGGPAGHYQSGRLINPFVSPPYGGERAPWTDPERGVEVAWVWFGPGDTVERVDVEPVQSSPLFQRLVDCLRRLLP